MVGLLADYGSGSEESDTEQQPIVKSPPKAEAKPPAKQQVKRPKKIGIALPALSAKRSEIEDADDAKDNPPAKRPKIGAGKSALLSMLPTPTKPNVPPQQPQRVLGGGSGPGLIFNSAPSGSQTYSEENATAEAGPSGSTFGASVTEPVSRPSLLPPSLQKRRPNVSLEESAPVKRPEPAAQSAPAVDFFSLGSTLKGTTSKQSASTSLASIPSMSAAPSLPEFKPPEPSPYDPYPGYYQLPSGAWAQYDTEYFARFTKKWKKEYDNHVRALEKGVERGFEGMNDAGVQEVDPALEMEKAKKEIKEREERKALTAGAGAGPAAPKMKITAAKMSGVARSRHQLATLLKDAYENKEALEEKIAEGRRNRKEAGNKYGF
ncbi:hypothetical protein FA15DRAFT_190574 [Coprinopsis marcescibilis]|uniref:Mitotic checkpoint regulator, MAD2B-interacting-domain-containing protein n=1 Tax=Coprinopsis marcescibilis TaxID=230819 RepID=A0A5C3LC06_COPMA|nr:hypothetical protein FA15DRAFT_190574 [Coprinopsis marcescibilis]